MYSVSCILYLLQQMSLFFLLHGWIPSGQTLYIFSSESLQTVNIAGAINGEGVVRPYNREDIFE